MGLSLTSQSCKDCDHTHCQEKQNQLSFLKEVWTNRDPWRGHPLTCWAADRLNSELQLPGFVSWTLVVPRLCLSWAPSLGWVDKCGVSSKGVSSHNSIYTQKADSLIYQVCHASQGHTMFKMTLDPKSSATIVLLFRPLVSVYIYMHVFLVH